MVKKKTKVIPKKKELRKKEIPTEVEELEFKFSFVLSEIESVRSNMAERLEKEISLRRSMIVFLHHLFKIKHQYAEELYRRWHKIRTEYDP